MKTLLKSLALSAAVAPLLVAAAKADPVYMIAQIEIADHEAYFEQYGTSVSPIVIGAGAKVLVATPQVETLEGEWTGNWTVVLEFPSESAAMDSWYNSPEYEEVRELRFNTTTLNNLVIAPAFQPPA
ncbi:DUF1330 domain-containing protein [Litoreibacter albidus]|uniref:DUF1330 domain-containing protein n=1 Tax=Litoreibacter albidus TaxID=670155 RepID=UPI003735C980